VNGRLAGKVALVTGAARGQGAAEARLFAREGACVVLGDVRAEEGEAVASEIRAAGGRAAFRTLDVTSEAGWAAAVATAVEEFGGLDVLVNNAGILGRPGILETSLDLWSRVIAVNQTGPFLGMRAAIPALRRRGGGSIVNISSALATVGYGESASYTASKGALTALTRTVAVELAPERIRVNVLHPGVIDTPMIDDAMGDDQAGRDAQPDVAPMRRIGHVDEAASAVLYLASDEASFVTGATLAVDGGLSVW
jgi:NAD(P)-dependent dehydrogenase (short-subunit alcohol dehydrogenase family)